VTAAPQTTSSVDPSALFCPFDLGARAAIVAAVSGGGDSMAMLLLLKAWLDQRAPHARLVAVTIDHAMRAGSAAEAEGVARFCLGRGIEHRTLAWRGGKPATGLIAAAREARYRLLAEAARDAGADLVVTGHTADDQAETVAMRGLRGDGPGLAGMAPATLYDGWLWIARPLLGASRGDLRTYLSARGVGWAEDPTNDNRAFERARLRAAGANADPRAIEDAAVARTMLAERTAVLVRRYASPSSPGLVRLDPAFATDSDREAALGMLRVLLAVVGGVEHLPARPRVAALLERLQGSPVRATLSRAVVDARRAGVFLHREHRGLPAPVAAADGAIWDGRRRLIVDANGRATVAPAGADFAAQAASPGDDTPESLARAALAAEPALWRDGACVGLPGAGNPVRAVPIMSPWARFMPVFDIAAARAVAGLVGGAPIPPSPCKRHNGAKA
jgi:tRNA(Ile)-lysidine synthase